MATKGGDQERTSEIQQTRDSRPALLRTISQAPEDDRSIQSLDVRPTLGRTISQAPEDDPLNQGVRFSPADLGLNDVALDDFTEMRNGVLNAIPEETGLEVDRQMKSISALADRRAILKDTASTGVSVSELVLRSSRRQKSQGLQNRGKGQKR